MENVYTLTATDRQIGLPVPVLKQLGLQEGETVNLIARERQIIITPVGWVFPPASVIDTLAVDTLEDLTAENLAAAYSDCGLVRLSRMTLREPMADYEVEESADAASETASREKLPFHEVRITNLNGE